MFPLSDVIDVMKFLRDTKLGNSDLDELIDYIDATYVNETARSVNRMNNLIPTLTEVVHLCHR